MACRRGRAIAVAPGMASGNEAYTCGVKRAPSRFATPGRALASWMISGVLVRRAAR